MKDIINEIMNYAIEYRLKVNKEWNFSSTVMKFFEETGELSEALMIVDGKLKHKTLSEPVIGEICDVINSLLDSYVNTNFKIFKVDDYSFDNLYKEANLNIKNDLNFKYNRISFFQDKVVEKTLSAIFEMKNNIDCSDIKTQNVCFNKVFDAIKILIEMSILESIDKENLEFYLNKKLTKWKNK